VYKVSQLWQRKEERKGKEKREKEREDSNIDQFQRVRCEYVFLSVIGSARLEDCGKLCH
jgi:hypothetical protein